MYHYQRQIIAEAAKYQKDPTPKEDTPMKDPEGAMAITQLRSIIEKANDILPTLKAESQLEAWVQSKISLADDYITTVRDHIKQNADVVDESAPVSEQIIKPTRMEVQKHFDAQTGSQRDRVLSTERALMVSELMVGDDGVVSTYKFNTCMTEETLTEEHLGRIQIHYDSVNGYGKKVKIIATVPPVQEKPIDSKYDLLRYVEKYIKDMKSKGVIKGNYEIVYPHDSKFLQSQNRKQS